MNIEINKPDGFDILTKSLASGKNNFNLTLDFTKDIKYNNKKYSDLMNNIKSLVKEKNYRCN